MARGSRGRRIALGQYRSNPYSLLFRCQGTPGDLYPKKCSKALDKKDWEDATCTICMECPHNAVLLLCSSHDKGCRPYMCGTSFRYSNCLDQYKKFCNKVVSSNHEEALGQVKGWTVVEPAREYLNAKKRSCMQDDCSFVGNFKELRKHMRADHPYARPRIVDPALEQNWRRLEWEWEDVISTIRLTIPGAMVLGDYVIEEDHNGFDRNEEDGLNADAAERNGSFEVDSNFVNFFLLPALRSFANDLGRRPRQHAHAEDETAVGIRHTSPVGGLGFSDQVDEDFSNDDDDDGGNISLVSRLRRDGRLLLGRSGRRRRQREAIGGQI
ncbi:uncharacterized protein LOC111298143 isoform X2 [Durio zibethinus]|uniref:Uncharacterized protein LOC111298143 isoform X2 n=1 Tax=Durio zibethinus TaxID=66656 RepID=A0A6P5Z858_DURZI|nr:uncharacterized protein LOC111298143 isoform X2 [Durio zibethinus]